MASLQQRGKIMKLSTYFKKPSPTCHINKTDSDSARNPDILSAGAARMPSPFTLLVKELRAGMTVEASIVLPLFLFFFMNLASSIEMIRLHGNLQLALWKTGNELAVYGYALDSGISPDEVQAGGGQGEGTQAGQGQEEVTQAGQGREEVTQEGGGQGEGTRAGQGQEEVTQEGGGQGEGTQVREAQEESWWRRLSGAVFSSVFVKAQMVHLLGEDYLNSSPLRSGTDSLMLWESEVFGTEDTIDLVVTYSVAPWIKTAGFMSFRMANRYYGHIWNGYAISGQAQAGETVYVAENGQVYHLDRSCTHLKLSVREISPEALDAARNNYGKRYEACEKCAQGRRTEIVFITGEGDKYHYNRACPGLKRTVSPMLKQDAEKRYRPCSRCGTKKEEAA